MEGGALRRRVIAALLLAAVWATACAVSKDIVDIRPPADLPPLEQLDPHPDSVPAVHTRPTPGEPAQMHRVSEEAGPT